MSIFIYPKHGMLQEMMLKEAKWTAKFIKELREEEEEKRLREKVATDVIMKFIARNDSSANLRCDRITSPAASQRSKSQSSLCVAGGMAMDSYGSASHLGDSLGRGSGTHGSGRRSSGRVREYPP
eukprot:TRINITY_DN3311_c0_g2_i1.p1 TRINITY_DN3311_c0_g2~~TRINITY_DN3311_c0_g2_i1.p1  ORF type:complete len:125 (-),score=16.14 TRINITY_DN3311_c0_g2_i1:116-490(-)